MANRYLRATGNWNGPVWAATSDGAAGSAATPTVNDTVRIEADFTVSLTSDATVSYHLQNSGRINLSGHKYTVTGGNGTIISGGTFDMTNSVHETVGFAGSGATLISDGSHLIINHRGDGLASLAAEAYNNVTINTRSRLPTTTSSYTIKGGVFRDLILNFVGQNEPHSAIIEGSPTFRSLIIQSKNSAAHTVNFDGGDFNIDKFIAIGSSSSNRLKLVNYVGTNYFSINNNGSVFGQYVDMSDFEVTVTKDGWSDDFEQAYIGSNSIGSGNTGGNWLFQDPPKISTLVDPLTTAPGSNPNWTVTLDGMFGVSISQLSSGYGGGGYRIGEDD